MKFICVILFLFLLCSCEPQTELTPAFMDLLETNNVTETETNYPETTQPDTDHTESETQETEIPV